MNFNQISIIYLLIYSVAALFAIVVLLLALPSIYRGLKDSSKGNNT